MSTYLTSPHTRAFVAAVTAIWPVTGAGKAPEDLTFDAHGKLLEPYAVVWAPDTAQFDGSVAIEDLDGDAWPVTQVTCVGATQDQADRLRDKIRGDLVGRFLTVEGRRVGPIRLELSLRTTRDEKVTPALFYAIDQYRAYSTPA